MTQSLAQLGPVQTTVREAQRALDALWARTEIEMRAYTGNIVALTEKRHLERVEEALSQLGGRYAGRQIIGVMDGDESVGVTACLVPQRGLYVERLVLDANPEQLRGAILPLLRPATVNHIWWASSTAPGGELLAELAELADQVIADTLRLGIPVDHRYALSDLGWARTAGWRELTAQLFDAPEAAAQLPKLTGITVRHAGSNRSPARLFAGWITSKLGWLDFSRVRLESDAGCSRENGDLCGVELTGNGVRFSIGAQAHSVQSACKYGEVEHAMEVPLPHMTLAEGLGVVMAQVEQNENFLDALEVARRLS